MAGCRCRPTSPSMVRRKDQPRPDSRSPLRRVPRPALPPRRAPRAPGTVDLDKPSAARVYDYFLGGTTNYAIDREFGKAILQTMPLVGPLARQNLIWTDRVVRAAMAAGLRQFIDLGSGIPTHG